MNLMRQRKVKNWTTNGAYDRITKTYEYSLWGTDLVKIIIS